MFYRSCVSRPSRCVLQIMCFIAFRCVLQIMCFMAFTCVLEIMCFIAFSCVLQIMCFIAFSCVLQIICLIDFSCVFQIMCFMPYRSCVSCLTDHVFHALQITCFMPYRSCVSCLTDHVFYALQIMCFMAFSMVSLVTAIVSIQLLRLGLVNQATDGSVYQKEHKDRLILIALPFAGVECLFCIASSFASCRLAKAAKALLAKKTVGTFYIQVVGPKEILLIEKHKHKNKQKISLL